MQRPRQTQLNVRSTFAAARARELADATGMTATQVVEEALRAYAPSISAIGDAVLERQGRIWVIPAGERRVTLADANAALEAERNREDEV
jgi:hypothetical protein